MKAIVHKGPYEVACEDGEDSRTGNPGDAILKVSSAGICGSDLHMYEGRTAAQSGIVFGHEIMGIIEETGAGVVSIRKGCVVLPFYVS